MNARAADFMHCVGIDSVRLDGSQVPGGKNADLAIKWRCRDPTRRITLELPRSRTGKPASSTICCRPCTARATRCYSRGDVAHERDLRSRHSGWAPLSRTRQWERQPLGGPKSLVWVTSGKAHSEYMFSELSHIADMRKALHCERRRIVGSIMDCAEPTATLRGMTRHLSRADVHPIVRNRRSRHATSRECTDSTVAATVKRSSPRE